MKRLHPSRVEGSSVDLQTLHTAMRKYKCDGCPLGELDNEGPVVLKGNIDNPYFMIVGEAAGAKEDLEGVPFHGPAGELLDELLEASGILEFYPPLISNVVMCRPKAEKGSGRENNKPTSEEISSCRPYISYVIRKAKPIVILLLGSTAIESLLPEVHRTKKKMGELVGGVYFNKDEFPNVVFSIEYHPAFLLRKKGNKEEYQKLRDRMIIGLKEIKEIIDEQRSIRNE